MAEPRCGIVHVETMKLLCKKGWKDCEATMTNAALEEKNGRHFRKQANEFKLQVAEMDGDLPRILWIRNDAHPQRCLCVGADGAVRIERWRSVSAEEPRWRVHYLEALPEVESEAQAAALAAAAAAGESAHPSGIADGKVADVALAASAFPALCFLQNVKTGLFLSVRDGKPYLKADGDIWGFTRLRGAYTPGQGFRRGLLFGGGGIAAASVGGAGVAGVAAVGAAGRAAGAAAGGVAAIKGVTGVVTAIALIPGAILKVVLAGKAALAAAGVAATTVVYCAVGVGCGVAVGSGGLVAKAAARLCCDARDIGLYVRSYEGLNALQSRLENAVGIKGGTTHESTCIPYRTGTTHASQSGYMEATPSAPFLKIDLDNQPAST